MKKPMMTLKALLRRRKTTLAQFAEQTGVASYSTLLETCKFIGVEPCTQEEFEKAVGAGPRATATVPVEGIVVVKATDEKQYNLPPHVEDALTSEAGVSVIINVDDEASPQEQNEEPKRRRRRKSEDQN